MAPSKYDSKQYWEDRFLNEESFEWLASYAKLQPILDTAVNKAACILNIGCGNSYLPFDMYNDGYRSLDNMDFSATVISKMQAKTMQIYGIESPAVAAIRWTVQDALNMENIKEGSWDAVIDKSTSDCIACMDADGKLLERLSKQVHRVCKNGGKWIVVSYSSMRNEDISVKGNNGQALWDIKRVKIETESLTENVNGPGVGAAAPTIYHYVYICTKR